MNLFLLRHAHSESGGDDAVRPLSAKGEKTVAKLGEFLRKQKIPLPEAFDHSPLLRARQTAEILAETIGGEHRVREIEGMAPMDDVAEIARELYTEKHDRLLVGHEPHLGRLASLLICDDENADAFDFKKGGILRLEHRIIVNPADGQFSRWIANWMLTPQLYSGR